ncbi:hypothetical protein EDD86DRAFT_250331 [Gorgonomyces haynaldii]|nr:hypothetical protein EDD86DRAFT_250331 [Gorgonomyces haynaldii]
MALELTAVHQLLFVISQAITITGALSNLAVMIAFHKSTELLNNYNMFNLGIVISDFALCIVYTVWTFLDMGQAKTKLVGASCQLQGYFIQSLNSISVAILMCLGAYQYYIFVMKRQPLSIGAIAKLIIVVYVFSFAMATLPWWTGDGGYVLEPSNLWCGFNKVSTKPLDVIATWYDAALLLTTPVVLAVGYYAILVALNKSSENMGSFSDSTVRSQSNSQNTSKRFYVNTSKRIVQRAIIITSTFISFAYQGISHIRIPETVDMFAVVLARLNTIANPIVLVAVDANIRNAVTGIFSRVGKQTRNPSVFLSKNESVTGVFGSSPSDTTR